LEVRTLLRIRVKYIRLLPPFIGNSQLLVASNGKSISAARGRRMPEMTHASVSIDFFSVELLRPVISMVYIQLGKVSRFG
jgi:hypothetical protein